MIGWHNLSERQKMDAVEALERLDGRVSLARAADYSLEAVPDGSNQKSVQEVFDAFMESKEASGKRPTTLEDYRTKTGRLATDMGQRLGIW